MELTSGLRALGLGQCVTCAFSMLELPSRHPSARTARTRPRADGRVQAKAGEEGFQIYVAPIIGTKINEERFMMDEPSDGAQALAFHGFDAVMGQTYEVLFIKGDFLYEVSTYKELEPGLESDLYKSVNRRYAAEEFALQLRALCSDHPEDGPPFD